MLVLENERPFGRGQGVIEPRGGQRERIVDATGRLFSDKGYHGTSMADIGKAVGLEKGSLYTHITAKQDVLRELVERGAAFFMAALAPVAASQEPAPVKLRQAVRAHIGVVAAHPDLATVFLQEWRQLDGAARERIERLRDQYEAIWRAIVSDGIATGSFRRDVEPRFVALLLLSAGNWAYQWFDPQGPLSADEVADRFVDVVLTGILSAREE
jgi:AcrR family transcriptional regulator